MIDTPRVIKTPKVLREL